MSARTSDLPLEAVIQVLASGYAYRDKIIRKAAVIVSKGAESA